MQSLIKGLREIADPKAANIIRLLSQGSTKAVSKGNGMVQAKLSMAVVQKRLEKFGWEVVGDPWGREIKMKAPPVAGIQMTVRVTDGSRGVANIYT